MIVAVDDDGVGSILVCAVLVALLMLESACVYKSSFSRNKKGLIRAFQNALHSVTACYP